MFAKTNKQTNKQTKFNVIPGTVALDTPLTCYVVIKHQKSVLKNISLTLYVYVKIHKNEI